MRENAIKAIEKVTTKKGFFQKTEDNFTNMIVLTALRNLLYIEKTIYKFTQKPKDCKPLLTSAIAELLYLDTPDYAVINSYVDIAKKRFNKPISNFINAVLRNICREKEEIINADDNAFFPKSFLETLKGYDETSIKKIEKDCKTEPATNIVYKDGKQEFISGRVEEQEGFNEGLFWVQDKSSALPVEMLENIKGANVLDLCSAPGGKTAQLLSKGAIVTCVDMSNRRLETLKTNMERLNLQPKEIICADAFDYLKNYNKEPFDIILLDAPCSATGTIRRHPEIAHIKNIKDVNQSAKTQLGLLQLCNRALKPKGTLLYCNCSMSKQEGEDLIKRFLNSNPYKEIEQKRIIADEEHDGFFISKMELK